MKGWIIEKECKLNEQELFEPDFLSGAPKIKITKSLITLADVLRYNGEIESDKIVLSTNGIGVVSETKPNLFDLEKVKHVYIQSTMECNQCSKCINGEYNKCNNTKVAGEEYDGFLRDFMSALPEKIFVLPENISDFEALFINHISRCIEVVDKLNIKKGDYVVVTGANNFGIILSQLLMYYSAVPILITNDEESYAIAREAGVYYILKSDENLQKEVTTITSGRMAEKVVYINESGIPTARALSLASHSADVAFTGVAIKSTSVSVNLAVKKQLNIKCINNGFNNIASSINLLTNKAINLSCLKIDYAKYNEVPDVFAKLNKSFEKGEPVHETVIDMI